MHHCQMCPLVMRYCCSFLLVNGLFLWCLCLVLSTVLFSQFSIARLKMWASSKRSWSEGQKRVELSYRIVVVIASRHLQALDLGLERCKRLVEQFQDVHWIVVDGNQIAISTQFATNSKVSQVRRVWVLKRFVIPYHKPKSGFNGFIDHLDGNVC